ncbi:hypothetical protein HNY73_017028 [Argiope bruennichi]|uniref:Mos1 transposase HTH domain-containing protein n=1 Tax=Argiope bruennichi TaxID=94029 RepID=A0A8T0EKI6_ARGBR|nr:hypothetical protein HNY73_017028 [Argiope bruennichi]
MLRETFGNEAPTEKTIYNWFAEFRRGRASVSDESREGRPKISSQSKEHRCCAQDECEIGHVTDKNAVAFSIGQCHSCLYPIRGERSIGGVIRNAFL